jgi:hypothetical protein
VDAPSALAEGQTASLRAQVFDQQGRPFARQARWSSSAPEVAAVATDGQLRALSPGRVTVMAEADGRSARVAVTVTAVVADVTITPASAEVRPGESLVLSAVVRGRDGGVLTDRPLSWRSSDEAVAVVSSAGRVTAVGTGSAVITASSDTQVGSARITVSAPVVTPAEPPPAAPAPTSQELIARVVAAYGQALEAKDLTRVKALHPGISAALERRTREALDAMEDLRVRLVPSDITVTGGRARARVTGQWIYRGGQLDVNNVYGFERHGDDWVIVSIE